LRLFLDSVTPAGNFDVFQSTSGWAEGALTYKTAPAVGVSATGGNPIKITASSAKQFLVFDITTLVRDGVSSSR